MRDALLADDLVGSTALAQLAGCSYRQVDHWVRIGLLHPVLPYGGSGSRTRFDPLEVRVATVLRRFTDVLGPIHDLDCRLEIADAVRRDPDASLWSISAGATTVIVSLDDEA